MRTLVLTRRFWPPWFNGITSYAKGLVDALTHLSGVHQQPPVDILSLRRPPSDRLDWLEQLESYQEEKGFRLLHTREQKGGESSVYEALSWLKRNSNYDALHIACEGFGPFLASLALQKDGSGEVTRVLKYIIVIPVHHHWLLERKYFRMLQRMNLCPHLTFAYSCENLEKMYGTLNNCVLPPAIDTEFYCPKKVSREEVLCFLEQGDAEIGNVRKVLEKDRIILYMGPITRDRFPFKSLLKALYLNGNRLSDTGLLIIGRGFERGGFLNEIKKKIGDYALDGNVFLTLRRLTEEHKSKLYNIADVFFYPFFIDEMEFSVVVPPVALLEVMSSGLSVLTGGLPRLDEIVIDGVNGFLLEEFTAEGISKKLTEALDDSFEDLSRNARHRIERDFSIRSVADRIYNHVGEL